MKTKIKVEKVSTWLPLFSGFYETIWNTDNDEEMELEYINEQRKENGLNPVTWDDVDWNYPEYQKDVVEGVTESVGKELIEMGMIDRYKLERLNSPREYNFANDSIHVQFQLTERNKKTIKTYLESKKEAFAKYLKNTYTSCDGFISSYSNDLSDWLDDIGATLNHSHKLGSVLQFILEAEDQLRESDIYEDLVGNGCTLQAKNYSKLMKAIKEKGD